MEDEIRILIVEDSLDDITLITHQLRRKGLNFKTQVVENKTDFEEQLTAFEPDVIISDHTLPQFDSLQALEVYLRYKEDQNPAAAFILVTGSVSEEFAVDIIQKGADDYILKDRLIRLPSAVTSAIEKNRLKEQRRRIEEEKLHLFDILQKSLHEIFVFDSPSWICEYANEEALRNLGFSMEEIGKMKLSDLVSDFDEEAFKKILENVERTRKGWILETEASRKNRSQYPVQVHLEVVEQGDKKKILANVLDITESKENERQKQLAYFIQNSFQGNKSLRSSLVEVLKELCHPLKVPAAEIWARDFEESSVRCYAVWDEQRAIRVGAGGSFAEKVFETGNSFHRRNLQQDPSFQNVNLLYKDVSSATAFPIKHAEEVTAVMVMYSKDVIDSAPMKEGVQDKLAGNIKRKKTEEELFKIFELSPDALVIAGKDGYFKKVSPSFCNILGYSKEELLSRPITAFLPVEDHVVFEEWRKKVEEETEVAYYENRYMTADGKHRWFSWSITPFLKEELGIAVGKDITEHKDQVRAIETQNKRLKSIAWQQSHIVRAPLSRLMACVAYLEDNEKEREKILESVKSSAYELDGILKGIIEKTEVVVSNEEY